MLQECNEYFSHIDSGTYDRTDYVDVNRENDKKYFLRSVIPYDKELAQQLAEEQGVSLYNSFSKREREDVTHTTKTQRKVHDMQVKHVEEKANKVLKMSKFKRVLKFMKLKNNNRILQKLRHQ